MQFKKLFITDITLLKLTNKIPYKTNNIRHQISSVFKHQELCCSAVYHQQIGKHQQNKLETKKSKKKSGMFENRAYRNKGVGKQTI